MNFDKNRFALVLVSSIGSLVASIVLGGSVNCGLDRAGLCITGCGQSFDTTFGGEGGSGGATPTGGSGGTTVTGGGGAGGETGGTGGSGGTGCDQTQKVCDNACVQIDDPLYGCEPVGCEPCLVPNASATCDEGACAIDACDPGYMDCVNGAEDGCEQDILADPLHCGGCNQPCSDYPSQPCQAGMCNPGCGTGNIPITTEGYAVCLSILPAQHNPGLTLAIGGQYTDSGDQAVSVFPFPGCIAPSSADDQVVCNGLDLKPGTALLVLNGYVGPYFLCDASTFPAHCTGSVTLYKDGVALATALHPLDAQDAPWVYEVGAEPLTYWMDKYPVVP